MPDDWRACRRVIARHSRSFDLASLLFPRDRRDEVAALYAWCRTCDDAVDLAPSGDRLAAVAALREQLEACYAGTPRPDPVQRCFQAVALRRSIPIAYPRALLDGMAMDVEVVRCRDLEDLLGYCWRVAGTVGLMMCHVMGVADPAAARPAAHLGIAMQITNVCRDVAEDWERGRVYLPGEPMGAALRDFVERHLERPPRPPFPEGARAELAAIVLDLLALADRYYASADAGMRHLEPRSALAVRAARLVYAEIGRRLEARGGDALAGRVVVPGRRKLALVARALRRFPADRRAWRGGPLAPPDSILEPAEAVSLGAAPHPAGGMEAGEGPGAQPCRV